MQTSMRKHPHKLLCAGKLECMNTNDCCSNTFGQGVYIYIYIIHICIYIYAYVCPISPSFCPIILISPIIEVFCPNI